MMRRFAITGTLALGLLAVQSPAVCRLKTSARSFRQHFQELKADGALGPLQRIVFSLALADGTPPRQPHS